MNPRDLIYQHFLKPFEKAGRKNIGIELEFPLLNLDKAPVSKEVASAMMQHLLAHGFEAETYDIEGKPVFVINEHKDVLSFDNSYNNFEFSMEKGENLIEISKRFYGYFQFVQQFLVKHNHSLCGMGINPYKKYIEASNVSIGVYSMVREYLSGFYGGEFHQYPDFPAYLSSVQTHLDVPVDMLPRAYTLFARMDFVRALLFSNSLPFECAEGFDKTICFRDYLWEKSGFGALSDNVGKVEGVFHTLDDIIDGFLQKSMFNRVRKGRYELFQPQTMADYFMNEDNEQDIRTYLSFKNIEITARGTLEVRSDCAQPLCDAFAPSAFHLGILHSLQSAEEIVNRFLSQHHINKNNATLRDDVIYHYILPAPKEAVIALLTELVALAHHALIARGKGEEILIKPLFERAKTVTCPALITKERLLKGEALEDIIRETVQSAR